MSEAGTAGGMRRVLLWFAAALGLVLAALIGIGIALPSHFRVARSVEIHARPAVVHQWVGDLSRWPEWGPWLDEDPTIVTTIHGSSTGVGARQSWTGDSGSGELVFTSTSPDEGVEYDLSFDDGAWKCVAAIRYDEIGAHTRVTWEMEGDVGGNLLGRYFARFLDSMAGPMLERGLEKLRTRVESAS